MKPQVSRIEYLLILEKIETIREGGEADLSPREQAIYFNLDPCTIKELQKKCEPTKPQKRETEHFEIACEVRQLIRTAGTTGEWSAFQMVGKTYHRSPETVRDIYYKQKKIYNFTLKIY